MTSYLSKRQVDLLLQPIHPKRVLERDGMSYVEAYDIRAELNRVFGFGRWSTEILSQDLLCETEVKTRNNKDAWYVAYRTSLRLTVCAPDGTRLCQFEESHVGDSTHPVRGEAHGNALTNSHSYALKRCAHNLGDQFGLSLYNKGSLEKVVRWTLVTVEEDGKPGAVDTNDVPQVTAENASSPATAEDSPARGSSDDWEDATPAQPRRQQQQEADPAQWEIDFIVASANGHGTAPDGEPDEEAQALADAAHEAQTLATLSPLHAKASDKGKLGAVIVNPATGGKGNLGRYLGWRRGQIQAQVKAIAELEAAAGSAGIDPQGDLDEVFKREAGVSIEEATLAQIKQVTATLANAAGAPA